MNVSGTTRPVGQPRGIGFGILLFIVTLGFYGWYWAYKTEEEMKLHTGDGLGGVLGLVIWILLHPVMAFVIPSEVGKMYEKDGQQPPITGWTGLWIVPFGIFIIPAFVWFVKFREPSTGTGKQSAGGGCYGSCLTRESGVPPDPGGTNSTDVLGDQPSRTP